MLISESYWHGSSDVTSVSKLWAKIISLNLCWSHTNAVSITGLNSAHFTPEMCKFECLLEAPVSPEALNWCEDVTFIFCLSRLDVKPYISFCAEMWCIDWTDLLHAWRCVWRPRLSLQCKCFLACSLCLVMDNPSSARLSLTLGSSDSHCIHRSEHTAGALCDVRKTCLLYINHTSNLIPDIISGKEISAWDTDRKTHCRRPQTHVWGEVENKHFAFYIQIYLWNAH